MTGRSAALGAIWRPFFWAAVVLAVVAGFGLGGTLFLAIALHWSLGLWWSAAAQAHGHLQLFGWAGLLVVGVGLHFLPRLRGATPVPPDRARLVAGLLLIGLVLRLVAQPLLALGASSGPALPWQGLLLGSGVLELAGASLALLSLGGAMRTGPPLAQREGFRQVRPFLFVVAAGYWLALGVNLLGLVEAVRAGRALLGAWAGASTVLLALYGFLIPICIAMSARLLPLYCRTRSPRMWWLHAGLALHVCGLALRLGGDGLALAAVGGAGRVGQAGALVVFALGLGIFAPRRQLPHQRVWLWTDVPQLQILSAYCWLLLTAVVLCWSGLASPAVALRDAEIHLLGLGFITLLILGVGAHLLTGFARRRLRSRALSWLTLALANGAVLLRVGPPVLAAWYSLPGGAIIQALAGGSAIAAILVFVLNLGGLRPPAGRARG